MVDEAAVDKIIAGLKSERKTRKPLIEPLPDPDKFARLPRPDGLDHARAADFDVRAIAWMWPGGSARAEKRPIL